MPISRHVTTFISAGNFIWVGIGIAFLYWFLESFIHMLFFGGSRFTDELINPDAHEIWKRLLVVSLLILFGFLAQQYFLLRQRSENALKESEKKYRTIFEQALNPIFLFDDKGRFVDNNHAALAFLECSQEEMLAKSFAAITGEKSQQEDTEQAAFIDESGILEFDYPARSHSKTMLLNLVPFNSQNRLFIYGIGQDITKRKEIERTLEQAHAELDQIFQTASVGMRVIDLSCNVMKINTTFSAMANVTEKDAVNKKCHEIFSGPMCHTVGCPIARVVAGETSFETYVDKTRADGKIIPCILTATPFSGPNGEVVGIVESFRDITQLKEAHEIIHSERDKLQSILSQLQEGVSIVNSDYVIEYQNELLGKEFGDCRGKKCHTVFIGSSRPCSPCPMLVALQTGKSQILEYETSDGRSYEQTYTLITDIDGRDKAVALLRDITVQKSSLAAAMHAERLAAVGELAAGVAHEINNPINGIINYAQIISNKSEKGDMIHDVADRMVSEGNRIARIVEGLLTFSRRRQEEKMVVFVQDILSDSLTLTTAQMRKDSIIFNIDIAENLPMITAQAHQIQQVFINIISNARFALIQKYPGPNDDKLLEITAKAIKSNDIEYIRVSFLDHGAGIPANIIDKVKTPFFSTKTEDNRTGLGLSISHDIVEHHKGVLSIESKEGEFTRIDVDLPA